MSFARLVRLLLIAGCVGLFAGCPGTDPLGSSFGNVDTEAAVRSSSGTRFDQARVVIEQILVQPADPVSQAAAGSRPIGLLSSPVVLTVENSSATVTIGNSRLPQGTLEVIGVRITLRSVEDFNPPASPSTCIENFGLIPPDYSNIGVGPAVQATSLTPTNAPARVVIEPGSNTLIVDFDFQVLVDALLNVFEPVCRDSSPCSFGSGRTVQPPCIPIRQNWANVNAGLVDALRISVP